MSVQSVAGRWSIAHRDSGELGLGFRTTYSNKGVSAEVKALSVDASYKFTPKKVDLGVSTGVAQIEVTSTSPKGNASGTFKAEALTAKAGVKLDASRDGFEVFSASASAHIAKTTVGGGVKIGRLTLEGEVSAGAGAAAGIEVGGRLVGNGPKGVRVGGEIGKFGTVGFSLAIKWG